MSHRSFTDREGVRWKVSVLEPAKESGERERRAEPRPRPKIKGNTPQLATRPLEVSQLHFESRSSRRQLTPIPAGWEQMDDVELEDLLADSTPVHR